MHGARLKTIIRILEELARQCEEDGLRFAQFPISSEYCRGEAHGLLRAAEMLDRELHPAGRKTVMT